MEKKAEKAASAGAVRRYPRYFRYLRELLMNGVLRVSSSELASRLSVTPSQVRSDLNRFAGAGIQGYGYQVKPLYTELSRKLGAGDKRSAVILGGNRFVAEELAGKLEGRGVFVRHHFSSDATEEEAPFSLPFSALKETLAEERCDLALLLSLPDTLTPEDLVAAGIRGIWNLTQTDLVLPIPVINLPVGDVVMRLCYEIRCWEGKA